MLSLHFQPVSQKLIANTRLADGNGTIFRLKDSVTIPAKTASGGEILPGQATVTLVADVGGSAGNIPLSDFTVVAFKGMPREKLVYGRGKTAFTGGLEGSVFYLTDDEYTSTTSDLAGQLSNKLHDAIVKQIPEGYVLLQDSLVFSPGQNVNPGPQSKADITLSYVGKMRGILVRQSDLDATYLQNIVTDQTVTPDQVTIKGEDGLNYHTTTNVTGDTVPDTITFSVSGNLTAVWNIDKNSIAKSLVKTKRGGFSALMQTFPAIKQAELVLRPFWINILPGDPQKIQVIVNNVSN